MSADNVSIAASRGEALTLLGGWKTDRALIRVEFRFRLFAATFLARIVTVQPDEVRLMSDDKWAELALPIPENVTFRFLDINALAKRARFAGMLMMFYPFVVDPEESDQIIFAEVDERTIGPDPPL